MYKFSKSSLEKLSTCHEDLEIIAKEAIKYSPYDFGISEGYRSPQKQNEYYQRGRTKPGNIITYLDGFNKTSKHNTMPSSAFDIKCYVNGSITWQNAIYLEVGLHIMEVSERLFEENKIKHQLTWGGYWKKFKDLPHYQI